MERTRETTWTPLLAPAATGSLLKSLYRGLPVTLLFSVPALSVYLSCYESTKTFLAGHAVGRGSILNHLVSGCVAEVAAGTLFTPMEVMKNRLQTAQGESGRSLAKTIWRDEGLRGFFRGYWMGLAVFVPHTMVYFAVYEQLKLQVFGSLPDNDASQLTFGAYMACSAVASAIGITISTPLDIIKTRWQVAAGDQGAAFRTGPVDIARQMWVQEGPRAFFSRGLLARIAWGIPTTAISMTVFEMLKDYRRVSAI